MAMSALAARWPKTIQKRIKLVGSETRKERKSFGWLKNWAHTQPQIWMKVNKLMHNGAARWPKMKPDD